MANGKIHCCGSPLFLKQAYGVGYTFTISLHIGIKFEDVKDAIDDLIKQHVEDAQFLSIAGGEINYRLPFEDSANFAPMFETFDNLEINGAKPINSYGISVTTLEEVFLKIGLTEQSGTDALAGRTTATNTKEDYEVKMAPRDEKEDSEEVSVDTGSNDKEIFDQPAEFQLDLQQDESLNCLCL